MDQNNQINATDCSYNLHICRGNSKRKRGGLVRPPLTVVFVVETLSNQHHLARGLNICAFETIEVNS